MPGTGGATGGSTNVGTGGDATGTGGTDATGGSATGGSETSGTGGGGTATGGSDGSGGAGGRGQSTGGAPGSNGGTTGGGCGAAAFCDDFERPMLGPDWMTEQGSNTIEISTTQHHSGTSSVHIKYTGAGATYLNATKGFPFPNDTFWGRVWLYAMTGLETGHHVYIEAQNDAMKKAIRVLNTQKMAQLATNLQVGDMTGYSTPAVPMPQGKWSCFEWNITATGGKGTVSLYLDGTDLKATLTNVNVFKIDKTRLGYQRYMSGAAGELWYDDYAVGTARIGCN